MHIVFLEKKYLKISTLYSFNFVYKLTSTYLYINKKKVTPYIYTSTQKKR